jgi:probable HAF family extracellular repeat protein
MKITIRSSLLLIILLAFGSVGPVFSQPDSIIDLGTLGGNFSIPYAISDSGQIIGLTEVSENVEDGFSWKNGSMVGFGLEEYDEVVAAALNNQGQVAGYYDEGDENYQAFLWQRGTATPPGDIGWRVCICS